MVSFHPLGLELVEEMAAKLLIGRAPFEHMVEDHEDRMAHGNQGDAGSDRAVHAASGAE